MISNNNDIRDKVLRLSKKQQDLAILRTSFCPVQEPKESDEEFARRFASWKAHREKNNQAKLPDSERPIFPRRI